jgi:hypothetical protein
LPLLMLSHSTASQRLGTHPKLQRLCKPLLLKSTSQI